MLLSFNPKPLEYCKVTFIFQMIITAYHRDAFEMSVFVIQLKKCISPLMSLLSPVLIVTKSNLKCKKRLYF